MIPSFQEARMVPLYWVQMLSAMERPMPNPPRSSRLVLWEVSSR